MDQTKNKKVLIIEDDVFLGDVLLEKISNEYQAELSRDGKEGLEKMKVYQPDLVLLDIILPSMNGYEILEQKKNDPTIASIPVVIISNSGQPVELNRVMSLGVKDYLIKTQFEPNEVLAKVRLSLARAEAEKNTPATNTQAPKPSLDQIPQSGVSVANIDGPVSNQQNTQALQGKKVMWVEDDKFLSDLISKKLANQGCTLVHASDGTSAFPIIEKEQPNVVLLDVLLPGMNGFDILQKIKNTPTTSHIPVLMLSNMSQRSDIEKSEKLGANKFLVKATVTLDEIVQEIRKLI